MATRSMRDWCGTGRRVGRIALLAAGTALAVPLAALAQAGGGSGPGGPSCTNAQPNHASLAGMVVGFSQSENEQNPFRAAETQSVKDGAAKAGVKRLLYTNANDSQAKQVADIESMIAQGAQALIVAPLNATGLQPAFAQAAAKNIPVITIDRKTAGTPCMDYLTFVGSNFTEQGKRSAEAMNKATGGKAKILEIQGAYGNTVESQRTSGFADALKGNPGLKLLAAQTGNWSATDAQRVMEQLLLAHPDADALYSHADVMTLGAMRAIQQAGKVPGKDIRIVSIDGTKALVQAIADGRAQADIETNPRFGPIVFPLLADWFDGKPVPQTVMVQDTLFDSGNAAASLKNGATY